MEKVVEITESMKEQAIRFLENTLEEFNEANGHWGTIYARGSDGEDIAVAVKVYKGYGKEEFEIQGYETSFTQEGRRRVKTNNKQFTVYVVPGGWVCSDTTIH